MTFDRCAHERDGAIDPGGARMLHFADAQLVRIDGALPPDAIFLGREDGAPLFVSMDTKVADLDFRKALAELSPEEVSLLSYTKGMLQWSARMRFCGACGASLESRRAGHMRFCTACNIEHYPRLDPAVMMLVTHRGRLLLAQHHGRVFWSTLAGFVEPGETLEEAVARELHEETGLTAETIRYFGSQPWPLPSSLMIGFEVESTSDALRIDPAELADARWHTPAELEGVTTSTTISLSGQMIAAWREP